MTVSRVSAERLSDWRMDPRKFVREVWEGTTPDGWQDKGLAEFGDQRRSIVRQSFQGPTGNGKSAELVWSGLNFMTCYGSAGHHPKGAAMAVSRENLARHLWTEYAQWIKASPLMSAMFDQTSELIFARDHPKTWWLAARGYAARADENAIGNTLSGLHSEFVLIQVDESDAVPAQIIDVGDQGASTAKCFRFQQAGNPRTRGGMLYAATKLNGLDGRRMWTPYEVTADPDDPNRTSRISVEWAREKIASHARGREDPWVQACVLGRFPDSDINALLTAQDVDRAMHRAPRGPEFAWAAKILSADVGAEGEDPSCLARRQGCMVYPFEERPRLSPAAGASWMADGAKTWGAHALCVDNTGGWGSGWVSLLGAWGFPVHPIIYSGAPANPRFGNLRAEMWWKMAEAVIADAALPPDPLLKEELLAVTYYIDERTGKLYMEDKSDVRVKLGRSPNRADALAQTYAIHVLPQTTTDMLIGGGQEAQHATTEWEPFQ